MKPKEPFEWWLKRRSETTYTLLISKSGVADAIHVIEYEAYDAALARNERLVEALVLAKNAFEKNWAIDWNLIDVALEENE